MQTKKIIIFGLPMFPEIVVKVFCKFFFKNFSKDNKNIRFVNLNLNDKQKMIYFLKILKILKRFITNIFIHLKVFLNFGQFFFQEKVCYLNYRLYGIF